MSEVSSIDYWKIGKIYQKETNKRSHTFPNGTDAVYITLSPSLLNT